MNRLTSTDNPLLDFSGLPRFGKASDPTDSSLAGPEQNSEPGTGSSQSTKLSSDGSQADAIAVVEPEHVTPAVELLLGENRALIALLLQESTEPTWDNFIQPLDDANERLSRSWGQVGHLNAVMNSPELREVYNANLPRITQYYAELGQNLSLYTKVKAIRKGPEFASLNVARKKIIENELRDFRLGGAELADELKARFLAIQEELAALCAKFSDNLLDATNAFTLLVENEAELSGIPSDDLQAAQEAASAAGKEGWLFTLKAPSYMPVMQYADNRDLRERMYRAYSTRASEYGDAQWDNTSLMTDILKLRTEEARLLGFANYAELSLASKMANSPQQVMEFLHQLAQRARPFAERDLAELREFAKMQLDIADLQAWDASYAGERLRQQRYAFSEQEVKQYFPEPVVLEGMFSLVESLYGLSVRPTIAPVWHDDVRFFSIYDGAALVGQFYLDLFARNSKRGGAWMDDAITRRRTPFGIQTPVAYLNCNFAPAVGGKPAQFTHDEVITLFHEFGHGLHHLLTQVEDLGVSGINGVEWDAVELPSQFMENFCWEWDVLQSMTRHVGTGEKLPRILFDKMLAAKNFQSGLQTLRQIEFALFDISVHINDPVTGGQTVQQLLDKVRKEVAVMTPPDFNRFPNSFAHIFAGGYAAGYYSYKWAEVLSADAYSMFEESGVLNPSAGNQFRSEILAMGGSRMAMESFIAFRGREPSIDALLRHNGLLDENQAG